MLESDNGNLSYYPKFVIYNGMTYRTPISLYTILAVEVIINELKEKQKNKR